MHVHAQGRGTYYFLDRSLGPLAGTVGGLGTWLALIFKSAFALVGMGAYLVLFFDVPIKPLAVALTVAFAARYGLEADTVAARLLEHTEDGDVSIADGAALLHDRPANVEEPALVLVRCPTGLSIDLGQSGDGAANPLYAVLFLISPRAHPGRHLRFLANLAARMDEASFMGARRATSRRSRRRCSTMSATSPSSSCPTAKRASSSERPSERSTCRRATSSP